MKRKYLFYISQNYSFEILRPVQQEIRNRGDDCAWFVEGKEVNLANFSPNEKIILSVNEVIQYNPVAVFVPGNYVPSFIPGIKIQIFHGLEWKKKGHFGMRGCFDLYCTHGEITTSRFNKLAEKYKYFSVIETGWPKLDPLFQTAPYLLETNKPVILFAPTFSPNLTCALECFEEIKRLATKEKFYWLVKFHPKMNKEWIALYKKLESNAFEIVDADSCLPLLLRADVLLSDTSSIIGEFLLLDKPAVTYNNSKPDKYLINILSPDRINAAIEKALEGSCELQESIRNENAQLHPYQDGKSSKRLLDAVDTFIKKPNNSKKKPLNLVRNFKARKKLNYWKW